MLCRLFHPTSRSRPLLVATSFSNGLTISIWRDPRMLLSGSMTSCAHIRNKAVGRKQAGNRPTGCRARAVPLKCRRKPASVHMYISGMGSRLGAFSARGAGRSQNAACAWRPLTHSRAAHLSRAASSCSPSDATSASKCAKSAQSQMTLS